MVFVAQTAVTPPGNPVAVPMPVAPVVVCVILVNPVLMHSVGEDDAAVTVWFGITISVPAAFTLPQPPVNGMV